MHNYIRAGCVLRTFLTELYTDAIPTQKRVGEISSFLSDEEFGLISKPFPLLTHRRSWWWTEIVTFGVAWRVGIRFPLISLPGYAVVWQKLACLKNCFLTLNYSSINGCAPNIFFPTGSLWTEMTIITAFLQAIAIVSVWYTAGT